ncbi:MAG: MFS transporter [Clostridia bacterium]|nr:MFS transporter [Clostridia bacterium]
MLSDRVFRRRRAVYAGVALFTLATWSIIALGGARPPLKAWGPLLFAMGFGYGSMTLALANIKEVNPGEAAGIATSLANTGGFLGAALLQPAFGFLLDHHWQGDLTASGARAYPPDAYAVLFQVSAALIFVSCLATLFLREMPTEREAGSPRLAAGAP